MRLDVGRHAETRAQARTLTVVEHWRSKPVAAERILHFSKVLFHVKPAASASSVCPPPVSSSPSSLSSLLPISSSSSVSPLSPPSVSGDMTAARCVQPDRPVLSPPPLPRSMRYSLLPSPLHTDGRARAHTRPYKRKKAVSDVMSSRRSARNENNRTWTRCVMTSATQVCRQERGCWIWIQNLGAKSKV